LNIEACKLEKFESWRTRHSLFQYLGIRHINLVVMMQIPCPCWFDCWPVCLCCPQKD